MKYQFTNETITIGDHILHRIKAVRDFGDVHKDDLGGWIEYDENLSHYGTCWVYDDAKVYGYGNVYDDALITGQAKVCDQARINDRARISGNGIVMGCAVVGDDARVSDNAVISGLAKVVGNVTVCDHAKVTDRAHVNGYAKIGGDAVVSQFMKISNHSYVSCDLANNLEMNLITQCGLAPCNGVVTCYKLVNRDLSSCHDKNFIYHIGEYAEVENCDDSNASCASGLHFSSADYWMQLVDNIHEYKILIAEVDVKDIITVQRGKFRCRKAFIKGAIDL